MSSRHSLCPSYHRPSFLVFLQPARQDQPLRLLAKVFSDTICQTVRRAGDLGYAAVANANLLAYPMVTRHPICSSDSLFPALQVEQSSRCLVANCVQVVLLRVSKLSPRMMAFHLPSNTSWSTWPLCVRRDWPLARYCDSLCQQ